MEERNKVEVFEDREMRKPLGPKRSRSKRKQEKIWQKDVTISVLH